MRETLKLRHFVWYLTEAIKFRKLGGRITHIFPVLGEAGQQAGTARGHYFHQDLLVANFVFKNIPTRHVDIGSRIDGFVAHVATFRKIEVLDIRPLEIDAHDNIAFIEADLMKIDSRLEAMSDSVSCLHVIEHFGLGRYGDKLDPDGHKKAIGNIISLLKPGGTLYISFPIAAKNKLHFNAHRVFHPRDIFNWNEAVKELELLRFDYVDDVGDLHKDVDLKSFEYDQNYGCGIYTFKKLSNS